MLTRIGRSLPRAFHQCVSLLPSLRVVASHSFHEIKTHCLSLSLLTKMHRIKTQNLLSPFRATLHFCCIKYLRCTLHELFKGQFEQMSIKIIKIIKIFISRHLCKNIHLKIFLAFVFIISLSTSCFLFSIINFTSLI